MRVVLAAAAAALVGAAPAAALTVPKSVAASLRVSAPSLAAVTNAKTDKIRSCEVGDRRAHSSTSGAAQTERKAAAVACEQPPKSTPLTPDSVAKATAAALASLG
jgi:hypothetical protein